MDRNSLWKVLRKDGVPLKLINIFRTIYDNTYCKVKAYNSYSNSFEVKKGVRQGAISSPMLFNWGLDHVFGAALDKFDDGIILGDGRRITDLTFADDIGLLASSPDQLNNMLKKVASEGSKIGLIISVLKTKVMAIGEPLANPISISEEALDLVDCFKYLGSEISARGTAACEIESRIRKARAAFVQLRHLWKNRHISIATKSRVYQTSVRSVLLYGCETWPLNQCHENQLQVFENRCLRQILKISILDQIPNVDIWNRFKLKDNISVLIKRRRLTWLGHVCRMHADRIVKATLFHPIPPGTCRPPGGVRTTWLRKVFKDIDVPSVRRQSNVNYNNWKKNWLGFITTMAQDRLKFRKLIDGLCAS